MNREILFRGKRIDNGEWAEGDLIQDPDLETVEICGWEYSGGGYEVLERGAFAHKVDPSTVGQYTDLTDKNGVKIFEGDICKDSLGWVFTVVWDNDARFLGRSPDGRIAYVGRVPKVEVIGNIHDGKDGQHDEL